MAEIQTIWGDRYLMRLERDLWAVILDAQCQLLGRPTPNTTPTLWMTDEMRLQRIQEREITTRHDLKARLEIYCEDCGHEQFHLGLTSADIVENTYTYRIKMSLWTLADRWPGLRSDLHALIATMRWRGIKGAVGTMQDQIAYLGSYDKAVQLDQQVARAFWFKPEQILEATGQVAHRSLDLQYATGIQSALLRRARPNQWRSMVNGYVSMLANIGDTWNEGDVSQSVVRRVAWPKLLYAADQAMSA